MIKDSDKIAIIAGNRSVTFSEMLQKISLYALKTPKQAGERTLIFADNSEGWIYAFYSVWANRGIAVPVDASSTVSDVAYILNDCKPVSVWTSRKRESVAREAMVASGHTAEINIIEDYETAVSTEPKAQFVYDKEDTAVIIYTSGTTGNPKGVMLSYNNILVNIHSVSVDVPIYIDSRRTLILLPLHHVLPLVGTVLMPMYSGGGVAICPSMSANDIMDTLQRGKIAIMLGVPRLWQTLYGGIKKKIDASGAARAMFKLSKKVNSLSFSRMLFTSVHKKLGGHIAYFVSGGAALDKEIADGLRALGINYLEGYGMTETAPMVSFTRPGDYVAGSVGKPLPGVECKIINDEVCVKGPNVMKGYFNRPEETAAVFDAEGYLHTGDLGHLDDKGHLFITGRSKEIIVLSNGKNVQPTEIEHKLERYTDRVKEAAITQDGDMLKAIIVPNLEWAKGMTDEEVMEALKREVLEVYNLTVTNYKKLKSLFVYWGDLPRTRLEKLQRFKLKDILASGPHAEKEEDTAPIVDEPDFDEYQIIKKYIEDEKRIKLKPTDHIETDLAFDSLDMVALEDFIQQTFGTKIISATMPSYRNIEALAKHVAASKTRMDVEEVDWNKFLNSTSSDLKLPKARFTLPALAKMFKGLFKVYNRLELKGKENIPANGPFIMAPNHQSYVDGALVVAGMSSDMIKNSYFYATEEHVKSRFSKSMARNNNVIIMEMGDLKNSILKLAEVLKQGKNIIIFPEGARTDDGNVAQFKKTFAILAKELQIPIVPVCIRGAYKALRKSSGFLKPNKIVVEYLAPIMPDPSSSYEEIAKEVRKVIADKL